MLLFFNSVRWKSPNAHKELYKNQKNSGLVEHIEEKSDHFQFSLLKISQIRLKIII